MQSAKGSLSIGTGGSTRAQKDARSLGEGAFLHSAQNRSAASFRETVTVLIRWWVASGSRRAARATTNLSLGLAEETATLTAGPAAKAARDNVSHLAFMTATPTRTRSWDNAGHSQGLESVETTRRSQKALQLVGKRGSPGESDPTPPRDVRGPVENGGPGEVSGSASRGRFAEDGP